MALDSTAMQDLRGYFKDGERKLIYDACDRERDEVLIRLLWKSGRRISEILMIKVSDIDFNNRMILWNILKKKEPLKAWKPMDNLTLDLLKYYIQEGKLDGDDHLLHWGDPTKHISRQRADQIVRRLCKKAGIERVGNTKPHCHHFRHSFAIDTLRKSKSASGLRMVQQLLEHSNIKMTENYLQFSPEELRELIED